MIDLWKRVGRKLKTLTEGEIACIDLLGNTDFTTFDVSDEFKEAAAIALKTKVRVSLNIGHEKVLVIPMYFGKEQEALVIFGYEFSEDTFVNFVGEIVENVVNSPVNAKEREMKKEILEKLSMHPELLETLRVFFENEASLVKTSNVMKVHRNTVLYRLNKAKELTHLDPKNFKDAMLLFSAMGQTPFLNKEDTFE